MKRRLALLNQRLIGALTKKINGRYVYGIIADTENGLFVVDPEDSEVGRQLRVNGKYGIQEIERLKPHIMATSRVLFVGAHIGTLVIPISKICASVVAIEANPLTFKLLTQNIALNSISNCEALNIAASDQEESIQFLLNRANSGGSKRVPIHKAEMYYFDNPEEISVRAFSLDRHLENGDFDAVIMDIEGSEYFALRGMRDILARTKLLAVEFLPHHLRNVSGVTVTEFLSVIAPYFSKLTIPSTQETVDASGFVSCLSRMYDNDQGDNAIMFEKNL